ncbi:T9SS type A sorting domain-containing protein [Hymenobacter psychrophilus]|uniref:T9SS type A sorting domain-containing protein n=1 Tax=Hymenobacter psychrophilus TaxID=651662 RepID=UPI00158774DC|nr:T9SS type A sorting domain-containing protein [Hymenobacter psychrophilus]
MLTAATGTDANGSGYLRLTDNTTNQAGFAIDNQSFPAPTGFAISFEFFSYGGTGADGFSVFLVDADKTSAAAFTSGASGGSLGYAQKTIAPLSNGVPNGYIGIGIDEFGNYASPTEGRVGGPGVRPDAVSLRGSGDGNSTTDYPFIAGGTTLPFSLDVATVRAQQGSADFRRAYIYVIPQPDGTYQITVRIQNGNAVATTIERVRVATPPNNLRIGFAGSTGGSTNVHEIRNLAIIRAPVANDDVASTVYGVPVSLNILSNDVAQGSNLEPTSIDLDPTTTAIDNSFTVAGKGTFTRGANGVVTFTPVATFAGVITIPYTVASVLGDLSNPANITIIVKGADVATSISGPTAASPGSSVTYTVNTSNLGTETSNNLVPSIQLPANLTGVVVSSGSYDSGSGLVTFAPVASLAPGAPSIVNTVRFTAPAGGSVVAAASVTLSTPDPVLSNNTATITTVVQGNANVATSCATPGKDGPRALNSGSTTPNTYYPGNATTAMSATSIQVGAAVGGPGIQAGDLVMIIQVQGATIDVTNTTSYGASTAPVAGFYEYAVATNSVPVTGGTLTIAKALARIYERVSYADAGNPTGQRRFQVVRVPQYSALTVTGTVTGLAWNGETGGILALDVAGQTTFSGSGSLDMSGKGFRGGGARQYTGGGTGYGTNDIRNVASLTTAGVHGAKGEGWAGTPRFVWNGTSVSDTGVEGYRNGSVGLGAPGNAGGGATDNQLASNTGNAGGGGGGNAAAGGLGGFNRNANSGTQAAGGGSIAGGIGRWLMGGGGGAGSSEQAGTLSSGGVGGGIVVLRTSLLSGTGQLRADGSGAPTAGLATNYTNGGGGGGAGGTVVLLASNTSGFANMTLSAAGGDGGNAITGGNNDDYGPGGGGGGGFVFANSGSGTELIAGGASGLTERGRPADTNSARPGTSGSAVVNATDPGVLISAASGCLPSLSVALATATPNVQRTGGTGSSVNPALYTLTISNTGGQADNVSVLAALAANIFQYDPTFTPVFTLQQANGTTTSIPATSANTPTGANSTPEFGGSSLSIPAGATLSISFRATIAAAAQNNFAYQANATVTYNDPFRTTVTGTVSPGGNYANDATLGAAGGSNYSASSSANEDVSITSPLPVTLTAFDAIASGRDAVLTWKTATELNNDRFELERSFDGATFETIGSQRGQGTTQSATSYRYVDAGAARFAAKLLYYRLRQVDTDGTDSYSKVQTVRFEQRKVTVGLYPNPQQGRFTLDLLGLPEGSYQVDILDLAGRQVLRTQLSGGQEHTVLVPTLPQGSYIVRVSGQAVNITLPMTRN